jgi:hypothetical protein
MADPEGNELCVLAPRWRAADDVLAAAGRG